MENSTFKGKNGELLNIYAPTGLNLSRVILLGMGKTEDATEKSISEVGTKLAAEISYGPETSVTVMLYNVSMGSLKNHVLAVHFAVGALLRSYRFNKYKTKLKEEQKRKINEFMVVVDQPQEADELFHRYSPVVEGVFFARNLMSEPPNVLHPKSMAKELMDLTSLGVKVDVINERDMEKLGMNAILAVGKGSECESQLVVMQWNGGNNHDAPIAVVGKGVTFDTGGISLKPPPKMDEMKYDMGGAAAVSGLMKALAGRNAKVNVVGIVGLVENMPDGAAYRPGDIIKTLSGQTIEVLNTDAEGRVVLADALWYAQSKFAPKFMIDLATLTGSMVVALGTKYAGMFSNDESLVHKLFQAGQETGEYVWQMPMDDRYDKDIDSKIADVKNTGANGAGSITAAHFLKRFTNNVPWVHLDIAGTAWTDEPTPYSGNLPSGFGVRLLDHFIYKYYEKQ
jgi:leucyl aminopeptidase